MHHRLCSLAQRFRAATAGAAAAALFLLAGCGGEAVEDGLTPVVMQTDWYAQPEHGGFYQALATGLYAEAGLNVRIAPGGPNAFAAQKVARGQADFGMGRLDDIALRIDKGLPLVIVSALMQHDPQGLMLHADNPIDSIAEMDGQTIMITPGSVMVRMMEQMYGLSLRIQPLDFGVGRFLADPEFIQQCFVTSEPFLVAREGAEAKVILISEMGFDPYRVIFTRRELVEEQPEMVRAFVAASIEGWEQYIAEDADRSAAHALIISENKAKDDPAFLAYTIGAMQKYRLIDGDAEAGDANGLLRRGRIQEGIDLMNELAILENITEASAVYTTEFLPPHLQAMLTEEERVPLAASH